ncbi:hypothetical protein CTAYLR_008087 [Chrysophaeum taylorii]|uniref:NADH dehydrogenase [ubiquinone] 1 beta subcomplex subunit 9 n=1 Tax=Chrysophaeum taylorii TaxID=2483200 RepID=A0AAD7XNR8_9STRA|nr:hypothetical protein CTAYLR_008087 [Chrysophaeum taylorii]
MDAAFRIAASHYLQAMPKLTHSQKVCRLYRHFLKTANSWAVDRQIFIEHADEIRTAFDDNANIDPHSKKAALLLKKGEELLKEYTHPDPYVNPAMPGGSLYMRNAPQPLEVVYDGHVPEGEDTTLINPDLSPVREGEKGTVGRVLVNFANKEMI